MSWRGSQVLRLATVQCGSTGRNRHQWGIWQGQSLATLGADVAFLTETALQSDAQHALACKGLLAAGYRAVSHGRSPQCPSSGSTSSSSSSGAGSGVLLAVRAGYSGGWSDVSRHASGRAVAAVLHTQNGLSLRVAAIYGPVGACLPDFGVRHASSLHDEQALKEFLDTQIGRPLNINSYSSSGVTSTPSCPKSLIVGRAHTPSVQPPWHLSFRHVASWTCSASGTLDLKRSPFSPGRVQQAGLTPYGGCHAHPWKFIFSTPRFYGSGTAGSTTTPCLLILRCSCPRCQTLPLPQGLGETW